MEEKSIVTDAAEETAVVTETTAEGVVVNDTTVDAEAPATEDVAPVEKPTEAEVSETAADDVTEAESAPEKAEPTKADPSARLREAKETITRASYDAEAFQRRRDENDSATTARVEDGESAKRAEDKKREETADEKRAALEYAESYRARVRKEREAAAAKKKDEEKERIKAEEKAAREREIAEGIEREREEAKARSARMESLLERVGVDVGAIATPTPVSDSAASEPAESGIAAAAELPVTEAVAPVVEAVPAVAETTAPTTETTTGAEPAPAVEAHTPTEPTSPAEEASVTTEPTSPAEEAAVPTEPTKPDEKSEDYTITIEGVGSERDLLYIEGAEACKITIGVTEPAPTPAPVAPVASPATAAPAHVPASRLMPAGPDVSDPKPEASSEFDFVPVTRTAPGVSRPVAEPVAKPTYEPAKPESKTPEYTDFPAAEPTPTPAPKPVVDDSKVYEEEAELIRHSKESDSSSDGKSTSTKGKGVIPEYPDFEPLEDEKTKKKKTKGELTEEERDMLEFERSSRMAKRGKKSDEESIIDAYEHAEAERCEAASAEAVDTKPEKKPKKEKLEEPKEDKKPKVFFDKKSIEKNKQRQIKNDQLLIEHRIYDEIRRLEMDTHSGYYSFTAKIEGEKEKRARGKKVNELEEAKKRLVAAQKYEAKDNERYYHLITTNIDTARLPKNADREELKKTREELLALLKQRDEINIKLIELYSISVGGKGKGAEGRFKAIIAAKRKMYKQQIPTFRKYENARVSKEDKAKLCALLDERTELSGELARVNYMLKNEKAKGEAKRELKREKSRIARKLDENKSAIIHYEKKALKRADIETEVNNSAIAAWIVLGVILALAVVGFIFWDQIFAWFMGLIGGSTPLAPQ